MDLPNGKTSPSQSSGSGSESPQFPTHPPTQMPCPHWNHFPIHPASPTTTPTTPPISSYNYCTQCKCEDNKCTKDGLVKHVCDCGCQLFEAGANKAEATTNGSN